MRACPIAFAAALAATPALATELTAGRAVTVDLASFRGTVYFDEVKDGYRIVTTLSATNFKSGTPQVIRMVTTLNPDQTLHLSVPGAFGADGREATIAFSRRGDRVNVAAAD